MKNYVLTFVVSTAIFVGNGAFAMDGESKQQSKGELTKRLIALNESQERENAFNHSLTIKYNLLVRMPNGGRQLKPLVSGVHDDFIASEDRLIQIDNEIKEIQIILGEGVSRVLLEHSESLLFQAKNGNRYAQDELMRRNYVGSIPAFNSSIIDFLSWNDIDERCYGNDHYAYFVIQRFFLIQKKIDRALLFDRVKERANQGAVAAQNNLGIMYKHGHAVDKISKENDRLSIEWLTKAAHQGDLSAQYELAELYDTGRGVSGPSSENDKIAVAWYTKAAHQGHTNAQNTLGLMYDAGRGVGGPSPENDKIAVEWFAKAAHQGVTFAQYNLGSMYDCGRGVGGVSEKNDKIAIEWYTKGADHGDVDAQYALGLMYDAGRGVGGQSVANDEIAVKLYTKAAHQKDGLAQYRLGYMYFSGRGIEKNFTEALHWWIKSAQPIAKQLIHSLLTPLPSLSPNGGNGSFEDMLEEILLEARLHNISQGLSPDNPKETEIGLASLVYTHQLKKEENNREGLNKDFSIPQLYTFYEKIEAVEGEFLELIRSLKKHNTPGFMITAYSPTTKLKINITLISNNLSSFLSIDTINQIDYLTLGEQNVLLAKKLLNSLKIIDEKCMEADNILKTITQWYRQGYEIVMATLLTKQLIAQQTQDPSILEEFKQQRLQSSQTEKSIQEEIEKIEKERTSLEAVKNKIKGLIPNGAHQRNEEFLNANEFLK